MNKPKKIIRGLLILAVMAIGVCMLINNEWHTPPSVSGLGFLLIGLAMWIPLCPIMKMIFGGKCHSGNDCANCCKKEDNKTCGGCGECDDCK